MKFDLPSFVHLLPKDECAQIKSEIEDIRRQLFDAHINDPQYARELEEALEDKRLELLEHGCKSGS